MQYADDVTCIVSDLVSFKPLSKVLATFQEATGARLNKSKTKGLHSGSWRGQSLPFDATWSDVMIRVIGIWLGYGAPRPPLGPRRLIRWRQGRHIQIGGSGVVFFFATTGPDPFPITGQRRHAFGVYTQIGDSLCRIKEEGGPDVLLNVAPRLAKPPSLQMCGVLCVVSH
ncbi:hypothetical protein BSL78_11471 [Apostichopus japonicus]|uniref:Reverse transcriptase domain-containing protein n=1 Tax=Stichopus japonicus TaxID=307972 RepID=A0A2G8KUJ1_STIJA|nr:hypothetical protein BSL78_11471 [Apostichopus japonicus]